MIFFRGAGERGRKLPGKAKLPLHFWVLEGRFESFFFLEEILFGRLLHAPLVPVNGSIVLFQGAGEVMGAIIF
jgi:hypothetical protein